MTGRLATLVMLDLYDVECSTLLNEYELDNFLRSVAKSTGGTLCGTNRTTSGVSMTATLEEGFIALKAYPHDCCAIITICLGGNASIEVAKRMFMDKFKPKKLGKGGEHARGQRLGAEQPDLFPENSKTTP